VGPRLGRPRLRGLLVTGIVVALAAAGALTIALVAGGGPDPSAPGAQVRIPSVPAPISALSPDQIRAAYDVPPLAAKGIDGAHQTIIIVDSFGSPTIATDLAHFDSYFKLPAPPSFRVLQPAGPVPGYNSHNSNRVGWAEESTLDVEWAHVMAPGASIILVETPTSENEGTTGFPQIVTAERYVLKHKLGQVISQSFAATEQTFPSVASIMSFRGAIELAARDHVTMLAATGDTGATSDEYNMKDLYTSRAVSWPATDPLVTAVGGTQLSLRANGTRLTPDTAWDDSGGGTSIAFGRPSYQNGVAAVTGNARGVPDVAMDASCKSAVAVYGSFYPTGGRWSSVCGTSLATPLFAGVVALADQYAGHGKAHGLGLINPAIYTIAARHEPGIVAVVSGTNAQTFVQDGRDYSVPGYTAGPGYNLVTGVGTIDAASFVPELAKLAG
jgi:subtilase family serine protease